MNIINKAFLKFALLPSPLYRKMGVNLQQLRSILHVKLMMDDRRTGTLQQTSNRKNKKPPKMATIVTMLVSALMGLLFLSAFAIGNDRLTQLTIYFSMFFFMLASILIADFTSVLIDVRDTFIILPKPVSDKTFLVARLLHIFIHICKIVFPMVLPAVIFLWNRNGAIGGLLMLFVILLVTMFTIFVINAVYIVILRFTSPERFRNMISYFQIFFAIVIYAGYQVVPRLMGSYDLENFSFTAYRSIIYLPFYWFAAVWHFIYSLGGNNITVIAALLGVIVPVLSIYIVVKYLAPSFNNKLAMINSSGGEQQRTAAKVITRKGIGYSGLLAKIFTGNSAEKMGFEITWKMMDRSRDFKLKVYPGIGYILVYVFIMFYGRELHVSDFSEETTRGKIIIISAIYLTSFILTMAINQMIYSDKYKASWIYYARPIAQPGDVILGGMKAAIFKFYFPLLAVVVIGSLILVGPQVIPNLVLGLFNEVLIATLLVYAGHKLFPFSMQQSTNVKSGSFLRSMLVFIISGIIAVGHFLLYDVMTVIIILAVLSIIATWFMMTSIRNTSWEKIRSGYSEE